MDTPTSTIDWALIIESGKSVIERVDRNQLEFSKIWHVKGTFAEAEKIYFTYMLDEGEKYCKLLISKCKDRITREDSGDPRTLKFCWTPINFAGVFDVVFEIKEKDDDFKRYTLRLDVLSKFAEGDNDRNFLFMLNSIREKHLEIYRLSNPSMVKKYGIGKLPPTPLEQFNVLDENMKNLENIVYQISLNPNKKLIKETRRDNFYALDTVDHNIIYDIATQHSGLIEVPKDSIPNELHPWFVDNKETGFLPDTVIVYRTAPTFNVYENQLLKRFLTLITICAKLVETRFVLEKKFKKLEINEIEEIDKCIQKCKEFHRKTQYMKRYSFLDEVQETDNIAYHTPVLQREVNYMRFHDIFKKFVRIPFFDFSEILNLTILDIPTLYEYWAVIQVVDILNNLQGWDKKLPIKQENEFGYLYRLTSDNSLIELFNGEKKVSLFYQKTYKTYVAGRELRPDITLEMHINGKSKILVLDPKYRSNLGAKDSNDSESAINKMHVYKDAIRGNDFSVEAAYAIYLDKNDPDNYDKIGIGGIRLFPKENDATGIENLKRIIQNFIDNKNTK